VAVETKRCSACKRERPAGDFQRDRSRRDGLQAACRECHNGRQNGPAHRRQVAARGWALEQLRRRHPGEFRELMDGRLAELQDAAAGAGLGRLPDRTD
jgi:hypothetical protein